MSSFLNNRLICLIAIIGCAILWITAPFIAINILTLSDQPTALQFITDDITYLGELSESPAFWAAVISLIGIVLCFFCTILGQGSVVRIIALSTEIPLTLALINVFKWVETDEIFEALGVGYWGISILFLVVIIFSKPTKVQTNDSQ